MTAVSRPTALHRAESRAAAVGPGALEAAELVALASGLAPATCRRLLDAARSLDALARCDAAEMAGMGGLSGSSAARLVATFEIGRRVNEERAEPGWQVRSPADVADRLVPAMRHLECEELRVLQLNTKNVVIGGTVVYRGNLAGSSVRVGEVFRDAVRRQAASVVVVHNHPSGDPSPSSDDLRITAELAEAGRLLDIELLDHVVVGDPDWASLRALGALGPQLSTRTR